MTISKEIVKELLKDYKNPEDLIGKNGIFKQLKKALLETVMDGELTYHLGYEKHDKEQKIKENYRNGYSNKKIRTDEEEMEIEIPRDRESSFEPTIIPKHKKEFKGFDDKIISMYARGMSVRDIQSHIEEIYNIELSPEFISNVTEAVLDEVKCWQNRPLDEIYPIMFLDAIRVKIRDNGHVMNKAVYVVIGVNLEGIKEVLGLWISENEGAKFWLQIMTDLNKRGVKDIFIACVDGLTGFPEAIESVFPRTEVQLCIVHMTRNSLTYVPYKDRKQVAADLKNIYNATNHEEAGRELEIFKQKWDSKYPTIYEMWKRNWQRIIPFLAYPEYIRKAIYTTNAIESLNFTLRKISKTRGSFPTDEAALKLLYLGLRNAAKKWTMPIREWKQALNQFAIIFSDRIPF